MNNILVKMKLTMVLSSDRMYYPSLKYDTTEPHYEKYGLLQKRCLQEHHKGFYTALLLRGKLTEHLNHVADY